MLEYILSIALVKQSMMKSKIILFLIIILAFLLRIFKIDNFPATLYGDEQAFAWNAYNILKLGQDEYGNPYPWQFRSFDDYKAPLPVYILVPFLRILGMNNYSIRLPIVVAATFTVLTSFYLFKIFFNEKTSLLATFLFAVSPWHVHLSRGFFESTLALFLFILGIYFFLISGNRFLYHVVAVTFFSLTLYSYFTPRILLPVFILFLIFFSFWNFSKDQPFNKKKTFCILIFILTLFFFSLPLIKMTIFDKGFSRFNKLFEILNQEIIVTVHRERFASDLPENIKIILHNKIIAYLRFIRDNYFEHLSLNFWYSTGDNSLRYFLGKMGMFYLIELPFMVSGIYWLIKNKKKKAVFFLGWILLSPLPASLVGRPFAVRSLALLPAPFVIVAHGIIKIRNSINNTVFRKFFCLSVVFAYFFSLGFLLVRYYFEYPLYAATWWGWENKAALDYAKAREENYDQIFISNYYSGVTLAYAVYNQVDPLVYREAISHPVTVADGRQMIKLGKYYFGSLDLNSDRLKANIIPPRSLYIGRPEEPVGDDTILAPEDKRLIFTIFKTF